MLIQNLCKRYCWSFKYLALQSEWRKHINPDNCLLIKPSEIEAFKEKNKNYSDLVEIYFCNLLNRYYLQNFALNSDFINSILKFIQRYHLNLYIFEIQSLLQLEAAVFELTRAPKTIDVPFIKFNNEFFYFQVADVYLHNCVQSKYKLVNHGSLFISNISLLLYKKDQPMTRLNWHLIKKIVLKSNGIFIYFGNNFYYVLRSTQNKFVLVTIIYHAIKYYNLKLEIENFNYKL